MAIHSFSSIYRWTRLSRARSLSCHPSWGFSQCQQGLQASEDLTGLVPPRELPYICCCSVAQLCPTLCDPMDCSTPSFPVHHQLPELAQTHVQELVMPSKHLILCHSLPLLPSIFPSIRVFSNESVLRISWPKYWSFSFSISISPSKEYSGLISF